jgi:hypothetical protein
LCTWLISPEQLQLPDFLEAERIKVTVSICGPIYGTIVHQHQDIIPGVPDIDLHRFETSLDRILHSFQ